MIQVDLQNVRSFIPLPYEAALSPRLRIAHDHLQNGDGAGGEFTGWVRLPEDYDKAEFARIKAAAKKIQSDSQALVVIGIGGSYLGARGVIECLRSPNYNLKKKNTPNIYFIGNGLSSDALTAPEALDARSVSCGLTSPLTYTSPDCVAASTVPTHFSGMRRMTASSSETARRWKRPGFFSVMRSTPPSSTTLTRSGVFAPRAAIETVLSVVE